MSALARYFIASGVEVSGYDRTRTPLTEELEANGIEVTYEENPDALPKGITDVIYTPAMPETSPLMRHFRETGLPIAKRAEALGELSRKYPTIAVAGTHGKTTTSCIIARLLSEAGKEMLALLGGLSLDFNANYYLKGEPEWMVTEADEYDRSFLQLNPKIGVITSIEPDHLEIYGSEDKIIESFRQFTANIDPNGWLVCHHSVVEKMRGYHPNILIYGFKDAPNYVSEWSKLEGWVYFNATVRDVIHTELKFRFPGKYNMENALAAIIVAQLAGVGPDHISSGIAEFKGIYRRFEYLSEEPIIIDDYAHHPSEIKAFISAVREMFPDNRILGVFQPHLYSRTKDQAEGFAEALSELDQVVLLPIYPAREEPIEGITSRWLLEKINNRAKAVVPKEMAIEYIQDQEFDVLLTMGAGDIDQLREPLKHLEL